jgi:integrase/recombinase XerC
MSKTPALTQSPGLPDIAPDILSMLLADKRSVNTRRAYQADLKDFFGCDPTQETVARFLASDSSGMAVSLNIYKARMIQAGLSEATVNRRLAAVRSLIKYGRRIGLCNVDPDGLVDSEKVKSYRDTTGIDIESIRKLLESPNTHTVKGKRDAAILRLLWENGLRRAEVCSLDQADFWPADRKLAILGKGRGSQKETITLSDKTAEAIADYLIADGRANGFDSPLFVNYSRSEERERLTPNGLYFLVSQYAKKAGIDKHLSPHRIRHSAITAALDASGGDVRAVQRLSRHAKLDTLMVYDDNRKNAQGDLTRLLSSLA